MTYLEQCAIEISEFLGVTRDYADERLARGFFPNHEAVAVDFRAFNPVGDEQLMDWYRKTDAYIWELTAYHFDPGFNYFGSINGILQSCQTKGAKSILSLGEGIGDLSLLAAEGTTDFRFKESVGPFESVYHDLSGSRTAAYAESRFKRRSLPITMRLGSGWEPIQSPPVDVVVSMDFMEHLPNVEEWVSAIYSWLTPGGWFMAQNAFNCGSGPQGSIPMHLTRNDHYEHDWNPLLAKIGFVRESNNWYQKPCVS